MLEIQQGLEQFSWSHAASILYSSGTSGQHKFKRQTLYMISDGDKGGKWDKEKKWLSGEEKEEELTILNKE